jgi:hypothetical protein
LSKPSASESPRIIAEAAENHARPHLQRPTESEVNAAGISVHPAASAEIAPASRIPAIILRPGGAKDG